VRSAAQLPAAALDAPMAFKSFKGFDVDERAASPLHPHRAEDPPILLDSPCPLPQPQLRVGESDTPPRAVQPSTWALLPCKAGAGGAMQSVAVLISMSGNVAHSRACLPLTRKPRANGKLFALDASHVHMHMPLPQLTQPFSSPTPQSTQATRHPATWSPSAPGQRARVPQPAPAAL
jgi:hypothetical protein